MAISSVVTFHVRDGRHGEQVENLNAVKRIVQRGGRYLQGPSSTIRKPGKPSGRRERV